MSALHVVVPAGVRDPARVSGGNRYDSMVCDDLRNAGWSVTEIAADGPWPRPDARARASLARALDALPDAALVLVDGLIASAARAVLVPRSGRLRLVILVHMVFGGDTVPERDEAAVLTAARAVITTSNWTRERLLERYGIPPESVHVARPGAEPAPVSPRTPGGGRLLCVGTLSPLKGQDLLVEALASIADLDWRATLLGPSDRDPRFAASLARRAAATGIADRVRLSGTRTGRAVRLAYRDADLLVVPSRAESYGMVATEALAAGVPVIATAVGGIPEALGHAPGGVPGVLVPPEDAAALASELRRWLTDGGLRCRLRAAAVHRRQTLLGWQRTGVLVRSALSSARAEPDASRIRAAR